MVPLCDSTQSVVCFRDTAYGRDLDYDPGWDVNAHWLVFGTARDSIELFASVHGEEHPFSAYVSAFAGGKEWQEHYPNRVTAAHTRFRLKSDGVAGVSVSVDEYLGDTVAYSFRMRRVGPDRSTALRATGQSATLIISSQRTTDRFSVVPVSVARSVRSLAPWTFSAGTYKVALVPDSLYEICRIPCLMPDTVKLTPSAKVTKRY